MVSEVLELKLGVISWRHDAAVHLFVRSNPLERFDTAYCGKRHPEGVIWDSSKAERLGHPTCRSCFRAYVRYTTSRIDEGSQTPEESTDSRLI